MSDQQGNNEEMLLSLENLTGEILLATGTLRKIFDLAYNLAIYASLLQGLKNSRDPSGMTNEEFADLLVPTIQDLIDRCMKSIPMDIVERSQPLQKQLFNLFMELTAITQQFNIPIVFPEGMTMQ